MGRRLEVCEFAAGLSTASKVARYGEKKSFYIPHTYSSALIYLVPRYVYVGKCTRAASPKKQRTEGLLMKLLKKNKIKNNLNTELKEMGVFSAVAGNQLRNQLQIRVQPALFHLRCPSQSHQRSARGRTRLTTVTSISRRSF